MSPATASLDVLERWMQAVVMHPGGAEAGVRSPAARRLIPEAAKRLESVVLPSRQLTAAERLGIYSHMYTARLIEVMAAEYPTTRQILGEDAFDEACRRYVARYPSRSRTLNTLSARFPEFLARHLPKSHRSGLAADVARIERAMEDVFDAPRAEPMSAAQVADIAPDEWARVGLALNPALRLLTLRYPANDYMNAVRRGDRPRIPRPRKSEVIVFRRAFQLFRRDQSPAEMRLLRALAAGRSLGTAIRLAVGREAGSAERLAAKLGRWFRDWAAAGLFVGTIKPR